MVTEETYRLMCSVKSNDLQTYGSRITTVIRALNVEGGAYFDDH